MHIHTTTIPILISPAVTVTDTITAIAMLAAKLSPPCGVAVDDGDETATVATVKVGVGVETMRGVER